ncbi:ribbon-helix-helix domain-containing protein [Beijerinckia sp. L45]|uniref:ribbon-helix-helix domain-containing protein n=1 Tax=Beijerinckia sp. L45 TaxID=1641855 RepID=UPI00131CF5C2|nr:ribbon-helix-helix domain-containing protein [Beijerinckia sp. L45]
MTDPERRPTAVVKHSLLIAGHATSVSLEDAFWQALKATASRRGLSVAALVAEIDATRDGANLSSAIRVTLLHDAARDRAP